MAANPEKKAANNVAGLVKSLVSIIGEKDVYLKEHSERVAASCVRFSTALGLPKKEIEKVYLAGLLHDIGIVHIPSDVARKPGKLTKEEMAVFKQHPILSEKILSKHSVFEPILPFVRHHHEAFDGSGYPDGLKGDEVSLTHRVLHIVDSYEDMVDSRSPKSSLSTGEALKIIGNHAGGQFDPELAKDFMGFMKSTEDNSDELEDGKEDKTVREILDEIVKKVKWGELDLPVLPKVVQEIQGVMNQPNSTIDDLANAIEKDGVVSVRLISVTNSPMYRGHEKIFSVKQAIPRLGVQETRSLVTTIANKSLYESKSERMRVLMEKLWVHSLACANASKSVAGALMLGDLEKFFLMGLVHDIGKPPLIKILTEMAPGKESMSESDIIEGVQEVHCGFGGTLLKRWGFPQEYARVAKRHESSKFSSTTEESVLVVNFANNLAHKLGYGLSDKEEVEMSNLESGKLLGIDSDTTDLIGEETKKAIEETAHIF